MLAIGSSKKAVSSEAKYFFMVRELGYSVVISISLLVISLPQLIPYQAGKLILLIVYRIF